MKYRKKRGGQRPETRSTSCSGSAGVTPRGRDDDPSSGTDQSCSVGRSVNQRRSSNRLKDKRASCGDDKSSSPVCIYNDQKFPTVDSAYDADEESATPNSSPEKEINCDPYEMDMMDDVPMTITTGKSRKKKAPGCRKNGNTKVTKRSKKLAPESSSVKSTSVPTSTPVLNNNGVVCRSKHSVNNTKVTPSITPEVTPILPVKSPTGFGSQSDESFVTPQIRRSTRKRKCQSDSSPVIVTHHSCSSQGDSGIVVSPPSKKRPASDLSRPCLSVYQSPSKIMLKKKSVSHVRDKTVEQNWQRDIVTIKLPEKSNILQTNSSANSWGFQKYGSRLNDSCFGFSSLGSPFISTQNTPPSSRPKKSRLMSKRLKSLETPNQSYRTAPESLSESSEDIAMKENMRDATSDSSEEHMLAPRGESPPLFKDDLDSFEVNKSERSYKPTKTKKLVHKQKIPTKVDAWVSNFNMEIEDIEKFDLNIE